MPGNEFMQLVKVNAAHNGKHRCILRNCIGNLFSYGRISHLRFYGKNYKACCFNSFHVAGGGINFISFFKVFAASCRRVTDDYHFRLRNFLMQHAF